MNKNYKKFMNPSDECIDDFVRVCSEMVNSKYILADGKITDILQTIAGSAKLYELVRAAVKGFDFEYELKKAKSTAGGKVSLLIPTDTKNLIAFVFCLLIKIDSDEILLKDLLDTFFSCDSGIYEEYDRFCDEVIVPFANAVISIFRPAAAPEPTREAPEKPQSFEVTEIQTALKELSYLALRYSGGEPSEVTLVLDEFALAIEKRDKSLVKALYIGLKHTIKNNKLTKPLYPILDRVYSLLPVYNII